MFGFFRTFLALWVMIFHLLDVPVIGNYAVFAFFCLSGFLMTLIMQNAYGYQPDGIRRYAINRFLRLYPMYWLIALLSIAVIHFVGTSYALEYKESLQIPNTTTTILANVSMLFPSLTPWNIEPRLSPPTWALTVEITYYVLIALGASKNKSITKIWLMGSILYYISSYFHPIVSSPRYGSVFAASLPFALGATTFHYRSELLQLCSSMRLDAPGRILVVYCLHAFILCALSMTSDSIPYWLKEGAMYVNMTLAALVVVVLYHKGQELFSYRQDKILGEYSYPLYLCHWQCGLLASYLLFDEPTRGLNGSGFWTFCLALAIAIAMCTIMIYSVDRTVNRLRESIRPKPISR